MAVGRAWKAQRMAATWNAKREVRRSDFSPIRLGGRGGRQETTVRPSLPYRSSVTPGTTSLLPDPPTQTSPTTNLPPTSQPPHPSIFSPTIHPFSVNPKFPNTIATGSVALARARRGGPDRAEVTPWRG